MRHEPNFNAAWARVIVHALADAGVRYVVIAPGSRSSPLVRAAVRHPDVTCVLWIDERGAGFHALGHARATGVPAAVLTTSGTAVANLLPACLEAWRDNVPLVMLTADRPEEVVEAGANQTIEQPDLFDGFTRSAADLQPDPRIPAADVRAAVHLFLHGAFGVGPNGPVHLNVRFDEPLAPTEEPYDTAWLSDAAFAPFEASQPQPPDLDPTMLAGLRDNEIGLIVATASVGTAALRLAHRLGWPIYPDVRSDLRVGIEDKLLWPHADRLLAQGWSPHAVLLLGAHPTSADFLRWMQTAEVARILVVDEHDHRRDGWRLPPSMVWTDVAEEEFEVGPWSKGPQSGAMIRTVADPRAWAEAAAQALADVERPLAPLDIAATSHAAMVKATDAALADDVPLTEAFVARHVSRAVREDSAVFLSNSMPVRDFDRFAATDGPQVPVHTNRGVSGIDGILSTAAGTAAAHGHATALVGDQAFLHDLNALAGIARLQPHLTVVLLNNGGGRVFSLLPIADDRESFSPWFDAKHTWQLSGACEVFGIAYTHVDSRNTFADAYEASQQGQGPSVIEVLADPADDVALRAKVDAASTS